MYRWVIDYEALSAWSTLAAAFATFVAIVVALYQSSRSRADLNRQLAHQNWLEQKRIEEEHLGRLLSSVDHPYKIASEFYFSMHRRLAPIKIGSQAPPGFDDDVARALDDFAARANDAEAHIGGFINIMMALREYHEQLGETKVAQDYADLVTDIHIALDTGGRLREWLADPERVISISPDSYFDLAEVKRARETAYGAARAIARRLVRLYERATSG